ncbi:unnamed protein product [Chondrus crispus]|uniref:Uncharacterized protein n=1 Tax=Chondrus crispus TaxID=2769 RepID=R7QMH4_CHOCR|nr:unnamed protein product [Chondrus crispus]CDF39712.1 unnamed protein product [Chondrus crispus]|eukprot:XP_005710006.1 unnamed protein product [Chondrus crispus]
MLIALKAQERDEAPSFVGFRLRHVLAFEDNYLRGKFSGIRNVNPARRITLRHSLESPHNLVYHHGTALTQLLILFIKHPQT